MKIILKQKVTNLGVLGDIVDVKRGYARNYLFPYGKAVLATKSNKVVFKEQKDALLELESTRLVDAKSKAEKIDGNLFKVFANVGEGGKLFGSVGKKEISDAITNVVDFDIDRHCIRMPEGVIRHAGEFSLTLHLFSDISASFNIKVLSK